AFRLSISRRAASRKIRGHVNLDHWLTESVRPETNWRARVLDFRSNRRGRGYSRSVLSAAPGRSICSFPTVAWNIRTELGRFCRNRAGALRGGSDRQCHGRDEARSPEQRREAIGG